jgi:hypothetical protein
MIIHAGVAKLYRYQGNPEFDKVMHLIDAAISEGLEGFEVDVIHLGEEITQDLCAALDVMGYEVDIDDNSCTMSIGIN